MKVLIACEFSGIVRDAFLAKGHDTWSCDLLETEKPGPHIQCDILNILHENWDLMIAHPPCQYLACSGARWWVDRQDEQHAALQFVKTLLDADIPRIALENPLGKIGTTIRRANQYIQPWQFGHGETKKTGLWLKNLPLLVPTNIVTGRNPRVHHVAPGPNRWKERSRFYTGIAKAMASQWNF